MITKKACGLLTAESISIPLTGVDVTGTITGRAAKIKIRQHFKNIDNKPIEAIYKFPLPEDATVCGFKIFIGDRIIKGEVEEREKAFEIYDDALSKGHGGYLLDQERPNIFTLSVGNIKAGMKVTVEIDYVTLCDANGSDVRFFLPTTISPRYLPQRIPDENGIPIDEIVNPTFKNNVPYSISINLDICKKDQILRIESPSHLITTTFKNDKLIVSLSGDYSTMDRDFVLNIKYLENFKNRAYICNKDGKKYLQLDLCLTSNIKRKLTDGEVIVLLDCSGSMQGSSIAEAKKALYAFFTNLDRGTYFNFYKFGSTFEDYAGKSIRLYADAREIILEYIEGIEANLGGTEILAPIEDIFRKNSINNKKRSIILITDGEIGNEDEILDIVKRNKSLNTFYTIGIGHGPNEYFIKEMARVTNGAYEFIAPNEKIELRIKRLLNKAVNQPVTDIKFDYGESIEMVPSPSSVYIGQCESYFTSITPVFKPSSEFSIIGKVDGKILNWSVEVENLDSMETPIPVMWAKKQIIQLQDCSAPKTGSQQIERKDKSIQKNMVDLSKEYGIISSQTSYVAIEKRNDGNQHEEIILKKIPVMLTKDWHGKGYINDPINYGDIVRMDNQHDDIYRQLKKIKAEDELDFPSFCRQPLYSRQRQVVTPRDKIVQPGKKQQLWFAGPDEINNTQNKSSDKDSHEKTMFQEIMDEIKNNKVFLGFIVFMIIAVIIIILKSTIWQ
jgi:Ca-activated chloride channel family protein